LACAYDLLPHHSLLELRTTCACFSKHIGII
jgi:hypothetical protein